MADEQTDTGGMVQVRAGGYTCNRRTRSRPPSRVSLNEMKPELRGKAVLLTWKAVFCRKLRECFSLTTCT